MSDLVNADNWRDLTENSADLIGLTSSAKINAWCREIHAGNIAAGWWSDLTTGACIKATRNRGEILMLIVSELAEGAEGWQEKLNDDKLPHRLMLEVEMADALIRIFDLAGADELALNPFLFGYGLSRAAGRKNLMSDLMQVTCSISDAMEGHRKSNLVDYHRALNNAVAQILEIAKIHNLDLDGAMREKIVFNASRADHKPENRKAVGGKAY